MLALRLGSSRFRGSPSILFNTPGRCAGMGNGRHARWQTMACHMCNIVDLLFRLSHWCLGPGSHSLQELVNAWHAQTDVHAFSKVPQGFCLQLQRFRVRNGRTKKHHVRVSWNGTVQVPCYVSERTLEIQWRSSGGLHPSPWCYAHFGPLYFPHGSGRRLATHR